MENPIRPDLISVTGTKGKSTIVYILAQILSRYKNTLRVDTTGYYINGIQEGNFEDSKRTADLVPTVCPGRFLITMREFPSFTAVLECALGSSQAPGLGYRNHDVGIFTNVYEDHIGSADRLKTRKDIALAKRFIFERLRPDGYAIFNADDELVCSQLDALSETATKVPCGFRFDHFDIKKHIQSGGSYVTIENNWVVIKSVGQIKKIVDVRTVAWTFNGAYEPSLYNLLFTVGGLWAHNKGEIKKALSQDLQHSRLDPYGGRLTQLLSSNGVKIIADYAHEKFSLAAIGDLAKQLKATDNNKVIGVVRLAYDRTDKLISDTAEHISSHFDEFIVYDKIDGHLRQPKETLGKFKMTVGRISQVFYESLKQYTPHVTRIIREDEAIAAAAREAKPGDVVVIIVNDNIHQSIDFIKQAFKAEFI